MNSANPERLEAAGLRAIERGAVAKLSGSPGVIEAADELVLEGLTCIITAEQIRNLQRWHQEIRRDCDWWRLL
jgi:hypothetical protein